MKTINILKVEEKVYFEKLDNGLEVYMYPKNNIRNNYVTLTSHFGSINNEFIPYNKNKMVRIPNGVAHFLEHKLFAQEKGIEPSEFFAQSGTNYNAQTSHKYTSYEFEGPNNLEENICYLLDYVQSPYFTDENVLVERGIIGEEIKMYKDSPIDVLYEKINQNVFINNPYKESIGGELSDIEKIDKDLLYDCYYTFYHPSNMFMIITGNFNPERIIEIIKENQSNKKFNEIKSIKMKKYEEPDKVAKVKDIINMNTEIQKIAYNIKIPISSFNIKGRELYYYLSLLFNYLFGDTSNLSSKLKENGIIINNIHVELLNANEHIIVSLVNETQNYETLIEEIDKVLDNITITLKDFERKKKVYLSNQMFIFNNIIAINDFILDSVIYEHKLEEKIFEIIDKLNYKDMLEVIKQLNLKNKSIVIVEKKEDLGYN